MKRINSLLSFVIMLTMLFASTSIFPAYADDISTEKSTVNIQLQVNNPIMTAAGQERAIDENGTTPMIQNGRTILPVRAVVEAMGGGVSWDNDSQTATLTYGELEIKLTIGSKTAYLNEEEQTLDVSPVIINGRTMLPIRFIAESFGFQVGWEGSSSTVAITRELQQNFETNADQLTNENSEVKEAPVEPTVSQADRNILIAYFTVPESDGVDAVARASRVIVDNELLGNTQYIAQIIEQSMGGDLFAIETVQQYPSDHDDLVDFANSEKDKDERPELSTKINNLDDYDVIFLGYPIWYADLPMPLYTFLEEYDLSGKTIVPFSTHGGSSFSNTIRTIAELQPNATVITNGFTVSRDSAANAANDVTDWVRDLDLIN